MTLEELGEKIEAHQIKMTAAVIEFEKAGSALKEAANSGNQLEFFKQLRRRGVTARIVGDAMFEYSEIVEDATT